MLVVPVAGIVAVQQLLEESCTEIISAFIELLRFPAELHHQHLVQDFRMLVQHIVQRSDQVNGSGVIQLVRYSQEQIEPAVFVFIGIDLSPHVIQSVHLQLFQILLKEVSPAEVGIAEHLQHKGFVHVFRCIAALDDFFRVIVEGGFIIQMVHDRQYGTEA